MLTRKKLNQRWNAGARILVTGSAGQLGRAVAEQLAQRHEVVGLDLRPALYTPFVGSLTDRDLVQRACTGCHAVVHTASLHAPHTTTHSRSDFIETNIQGTLNVLEATVEHGVSRLVYSSTTSLYGHAMEAVDEAIWVTEDLTPQPRDIYDITKIAAEHLCQDVARSYEGLSCVSLRVSRFFPEPSRLTAIYRLYRGVDVRDAVAAHALALDASIEDYEVFNISAPSPFKREETKELFEDAATVIRRHYPAVEAWFMRRGWELPRRIDRVYVTEKAKSLLRYTPMHNFAEYMSRSRMTDLKQTKEEGG